MGETNYGMCGRLPVKWEFRKRKRNREQKRIEE